MTDVIRDLRHSTTGVVFGFGRILSQNRWYFSHYNTAMWYMSDHGESLGENNLYLHGAPYSMSPETQRHIPMLQWFSQGFLEQSGLDQACLTQRARQPASHDNLFHSVLGVLDIQTSAYQPELDLFKSCRKNP